MRIQQLADAARHLFLERGVESVAIEEIVQLAGVAKGSFYRYFDGKEELVAAILQPVAQGTLDAMKGCEESLRRATTQDQLGIAYLQLGLALGTLLTGHPDTVRLYLQECRAPGVAARRPIRELADAISECAIALTRAGHTHGLLRDVPPAVSALAVVGAVERLLAEALAGVHLGEPADVVRDLVTIVLDGLRAPGAADRSG
jgi:AcrR family transcriptional regulator